MNDADQAHELLKMFCCQFELLYGHKFCVPKMHLLLHLNDCIKDYGSVYGFWCFSFKKYNGLMGKYQTNNSCIELQVMRKFISSKQVQVNHTLMDCGDDDKGDYNTHYKFRDLRCQVKFVTLSSATELEFLYEKVKSKIYQVTLTQEDYEKIAELFLKLYVLLPVKRISSFVQKVKRLSLDNEIICCNSSGSLAYSYVLAGYLNNET